MSSGSGRGHSQLAKTISWFPRGTGCEANPGHAQPQRLCGDQEVPHSTIRHLLEGVCERHRRFLKFAIGNRCFQSNCLPFGYLLTPHTFSKCVEAASKLLCHQGLSVLTYDWLILAPAPRCKFGAGSGGGGEGILRPLSLGSQDLGPACPQRLCGHQRFRVLTVRHIVSVRLGDWMTSIRCLRSCLRPAETQEVPQVLG